MPDFGKVAYSNLDGLMNELGYVERTVILSDAFLDRTYTQIPVDAVQMNIDSRITKTLPNGFRIFKKGNQYFTDFDVTTMKNPTGVTYYVSPSGLDSNDGLTAETPLKFLKTAHDKADTGTIVLLDGKYYFRDSVQSSGNNFTITKNINLIAQNKYGAKIISGSKVVWAKTAERTNVYQYTFGDLISFVDTLDFNNLDSNGIPISLTSVASLDLCDSTPNSYYDSDNTRYIHMFDSRAPESAEILVDSNAFIPCYISSINDFNVYVEGIDFFGGLSAVGIRADKVGQDSKFIGKNCRFIIGKDGVYNVMDGKGGNYYFQNCVAISSASTDGFNYHASTITGEAGIVIEINCIGRGNGDGLIDNGSTAHDGYQIIRLLSGYWENGSPNIGDTGNGTVSWNIGCITAESLNGYDVKAYDNAIVILEGHIIVDASKIIEAIPDSNPEGVAGTIEYSNCRTDVIKTGSNPSVYTYR